MPRGLPRGIVIFGAGARKMKAMVAEGSAALPVLLNFKFDE
jgi:hypothetical protein